MPTKPSLAVASARMRCYEPAAALANAGWDSAVTRLGRFEKPAVVIFQKAYERAHLRLARRLKRRGVRVVLDVCDNHFEHSLVEPALVDRAQRLREMVELADLVTASTPTLSALVPHHRARVVDDFIEPPLLARQRPPTPPDAGPTVAWFGNAGSLVPRFGLVDLADILPALRDAAAAEPFTLVVCTNSLDAFNAHIAGRGVRAEFVPWSPSAQAEALAAASVALLPVTPNAFTVCKTANRVATALLHGVPVVAGRIPSYEELAPFVRFGEWAQNVVAVLRDPGGAWEQVQAGRAYVGTRFSREVVVRQWEAALAEALE